MENVFGFISDRFAGWSTQQIHLLIILAGITIAVLAGYLLYLFYRKGKKLQEEQFGQRLYESLEDSFREGRSEEYQKLQRWLKSIGAEYAVKGFGDPFQFLMINLLLVVGVVLLFGLLVDLIAGCSVAVAFVIIEVFALVAIDQRSNKEMLDDIAFLYDASMLTNTSIKIDDIISTTKSPILINVVSMPLKRTRLISLIKLSRSTNSQNFLTNASSCFPITIGTINPYIPRITDEKPDIALHNSKKPLLFCSNTGSHFPMYPLNKFTKYTIRTIVGIIYI